MSRPALPTAVLAHRCLRRLPNWTPALPSRVHAGDSPLGGLVGTYRNPGADGAIVRVHADGLNWQGAAQAVAVAFADVVSVEAPGGATSPTVTLEVERGVRLSLPVRGHDGRFSDSVAMLRFLQRVLAERS